MTNVSDQLLLAKPLPASPEAERMVQGAILLANELLDQMGDLRPRDFSVAAHRLIFGAMRQLAEEKQAINPTTVQEVLRARAELDRAGGPANVAALFDGVPRFSRVEDIESYIRTIVDKSLRRRMITAGDAVIQLAYDEEHDAITQLAEAQRLVGELESSRATAEWQSIGALAREALRKAEEHQASGRRYTGICTGFYDLDAMTGGLQKGDLIIGGGRPGMGKSALAGGIATGASESPENLELCDGKPVIAICALEMLGEQYAQRMACSWGRVDLLRLRGGLLTRDEWRRLAQAQDKLDQMRIEVDDRGGLTPLKLRTRLRQLKRARGRIDLVIVDYLQLMQSERSHTQRVHELKDVSNGLKQIALEFEVPLLALASLNRACESRTDKRPMMSDLRDCGELESDADAVVFVYRDSVYNPNTPSPNEAELIFRKQRNGPPGTVKLHFESQYARFDNAVREGY